MPTDETPIEVVRRSVAGWVRLLIWMLVLVFVAFVVYEVVSQLQ